MRTTLAAAVCGLVTLASGCEKKAGEPDNAVARKPEDGVPVREVVAMYKANPAKALLMYENKYTKMTGILPLKVVPSPIRTKVFDVRCSVGDGKDQYDLLFSCLSDEAAAIEVGRPVTLELSLFNTASEDGRPYLFTRGRAEGDAGEKRP